jgi:membrane fusion protein (multidrug efflux system)
LAAAALDRGPSSAAGLRVVVWLFGVALLGGCSGGGKKAVGRPPPQVLVAPVEARDVAVEARAPVDVRPLVQIEVVAKASGYLDAVLVDTGDPVKRGQPLAVVNPSDLPSQAAMARGALGQADAALALARANWERARQLAQQNLVSQQELEQARAALASAKASRVGARAQISGISTKVG